MNEQYSHRNGETEQPTVAGWYWFQGHSKLPRPSREIMLVEPYEDYDPGTDVDDYKFIVDDWTFFSDLSGHWWGPITPPWKKGE